MSSNHNLRTHGFPLAWAEQLPQPECTEGQHGGMLGFREWVLNPSLSRRVTHLVLAPLWGNAVGSPAASAHDMGFPGDERSALSTATGVVPDSELLCHVQPYTLQPLNPQTLRWPVLLGSVSSLCSRVAARSLILSSCVIENLRTGNALSRDSRLS